MAESDLVPVAGNSVAVASPGGAVATNPNVIAPVQNASLPTVTQIFDAPLVRRAMPGIIFIVVLMLAFFAFLWVQNSDHRSLYPGMAETDRQAAFDALRAADFDVKVDSSSGALSVPASRYHEARMLLASTGLPKSVGSNAINSMTAESSMMTSQFMEQARYRAAIEIELAKTIAQISTIESARVHLATTKQSPFMRRETSASASVILVPHPGRVVSDSQVSAIAHLVSSSIPYLAPEDVVVVDQMGSLLAKNGSGPNRVMSEYKDFEAGIEEEYRRRINTILGPIVGIENVRAEVDVSVDFRMTESTMEDYDRNRTGGATRSESVQLDKDSSPTAGGVPGATTAVLENSVPPGEGEGEDDSDVTSSNTTRNYELDKEITYIKQPGGEIRRMSVAVAVNESALLRTDQESGDEGGSSTIVDPNQVTRLEDLVKGAVGFDEARGDRVTLITSNFSPPAQVEDTSAWYENHHIWSAVEVIAALVLFSLVLFIVVKPVLSHFLSSGGVGLESEDLLGAGALAGPGGGGDSEEDLLQMEDGETLEDIKARLKPKKSSISADMLDTANTYDDKVALARLLVAEDSGRVANVLKKMVKDG